MCWFYAEKPGGSGQTTHRSENRQKNPAADPERFAAKSSLITKSKRLFMSGTNTEQKPESRHS